MKKYLLSVLVVVFSLIVFIGVNASKPSDFGLKEGDLISAIFSDDPDVYIINEHGYKRLFLNPEIFKFYNHLGGFFNVKLVTKEVVNTFPTSGLFRDCESNDQKVYGVDTSGEDTGQLHWVNTTGDQAVKDDPDFFKKVFCINNKEFNWYPKGNSLNTVKDVPDYERRVTNTQAPIEQVTASSSFKEFGRVVICHIPSGNPLENQTLTVDVSALKAHLGHGDTVGQCSDISSTPAPTPIVIPTLTPIPSVIASASFTPTPTPVSTPSTSSGPTPTASTTPIPTSSTTASTSFTPTPLPTPTPTPNTSPITVTYPNGGSVWDVYHYNQGIYWTLNGVSKVGFKLLKGSQVVYSNSSPITANNTTLSISPTWDGAPSTYYNSIGGGSDYKIRVFDWDHPEKYDDSDNYFSIPLPDIIPPVVSSVTASSITSNSAIITWTTDEPATGFVNYGSAPNNWVVTPTITSYSTLHSLTLSNLGSNTLYTYRVYSVDSVSNGPQGYPPEHTFTTLSGSTGSSSLQFNPSRSNNFAAITRNLTVGSSGNDVKKLQALLVNEVGYSSDLITGYFGRITRDAVKRLQEKYGIKPTYGYFGEITRRVLSAILSDR